MSVLIKGMKKPRDKDVILRIDSKGEVYIYGGYPTEIHEAVELPDHGDLIDSDVLIKTCVTMLVNRAKNMVRTRTVTDARGVRSMMRLRE